MKNLFLSLTLVLMTTKARSSDVFEALKNYQGSGNTISTGSSNTSSLASTTTLDNPICENDQTSLPLSFLTLLFQTNDKDLKIAHDTMNNTLTISSPGNMISNCSNMLQWNLKTKKINGNTIHAIEAEIKKTDDCTESACKYKVVLKNDGKPSFEEKFFEPTLKGFEKCLEETKIFNEGKINASAIHPTQLVVPLSVPSESGNLHFLSRGNLSTSYPRKYSENFVHVEGCDHYEYAHPQVRAILTEEDKEKKNLDEKANELKKCTEYSQVADFIQKYQEYASELGEIAKKLLLEAAKKSASAIKSGKYSDEDLKVIEDFNKLVVEPKINEAVKLHDEWVSLTGDDKKTKKSELDKVLSEISSYGKDPYFLSLHTNKLVSDGKFEEAEKLNSMKLTIQHHQRLGAKENNVVITPAVAAESVKKNQDLFSQYLVNEREKYDYRTGQSSGKAEYYANLRKRMNDNIQARTENYKDEIQAELARTQPPSGHCYRYFRNTQRCIQESQERVQELVSLLQHYNNVDKERFEEYDELAKQWGGLEEEGRRYIATQNGEEPPVESKTYILTGEDETTDPPARRDSQRSDSYNFDYNPGVQQNPQYYQQHSQMTPQQYNYPVNPYQYNNMFSQQNPYSIYNQPFLGQQSFGPNYQNSYQQSGVYNFNWSNPGNYMQQPFPSQQQPGQLPYWNQPYQAYGNFQMYR